MKPVPQRFLRAERPIDETAGDLAAAHDEAAGRLFVADGACAEDGLGVPGIEKFLPVSSERLGRPFGVGGATWDRIALVLPVLAVGAVICLLCARGMNSLIRRRWAVRPAGASPYAKLGKT